MYENGESLEEATDTANALYDDCNKASILDSEDWFYIKETLDRLKVFYEEYVNANQSKALVLL